MINLLEEWTEIRKMATNERKKQILGRISTVAGRVLEHKRKVTVYEAARKYIFLCLWTVNSNDCFLCREPVMQAEHWSVQLADLFSVKWHQSLRRQVHPGAWFESGLTGNRIFRHFQEYLWANKQVAHYSHLEVTRTHPDLRPVIL